jgi:protocatechuate 3,4-dioxygenase beta subunit
LATATALLRRHLLNGLAASGIAFLGGGARAEGLIATPAEGPGPFYPQDIPLYHDADLVQVAGRAGRAAGDIVQLFGRVLNPARKPPSGVKIEIWRCEAKGVYHHPVTGAGRRSEFSGIWDGLCLERWRLSIPDD